MTSAKQIYLGVRRGAPTPPLPYDAEVEYLESTGTQWIDTGCRAGYETVVDVRCAWMRYSADEAVISMDEGTATSNSFTLEYVSYNRWGILLAFGSGNASIGYTFCRSFVKPSLGEFYDINSSKTGLTFGGETYVRTPPPSEFVCAYPLLMFTYGRRGEAIIPSMVRISHLTIRDNDTAVRDYQAVRFTNEQGVSEGAMYDRVSGQLFRNAGTGAFKFGTDIAGGGVNG